MVHIPTIGDEESVEVPLKLLRFAINHIEEEYMLSHDLYQRFEFEGLNGYHYEWDYETFQNHVKADELYAGYYELVDIYEKAIKENESEV